jgi:hydroxymethylpyrimidine/phosphomethylpyrimidine kinase
MMPVALTIAGSDSGGCAGIQADLKTFSALGVFSTSAITCITAQNTCGVSDIHAIPPPIVAAQIEAVLSDFKVGAIKTGMLFSAPIVLAIADALEHHQARPLVLDPVMVATSGDLLLEQGTVAAIVTCLFPRATLITPNLAEAAFLTGLPIARDHREMEAQGRALLARGAQAVLMKGGHYEGEEAIDLLVEVGGVQEFRAPRIATRNTHGTGCTLSAAIAAHLAKGESLPQAIARAKAYLSGALVAGARLSLGAGPGPVHHFHNVWNGGGGA